MGKTFEGIDCSGLIQLSLQFCNINLPRNTNQQINFMSHQIKSTNKISKGCLLYWDGHVGIALNKNELIHSNLYHLGVEIEKINTCVERIGKIKEIKKVTI